MAISTEDLQSFVASITRLLDGLKNNDTRCIEECDVANERELSIVNYVGKMTEVKMTELSDYLNVPLSTLTNIVNKLVDRKMLNRYHSDEDRRVIYVTLGPIGQRNYEYYLGQKRIFVEKILEVFNPEEQRQLLALLERFASRFKL